MKRIRKLPEVDELCTLYPISEEEKKKRLCVLNELCDVLSGKLNKKIIIVGPCSADRDDAVLDYVCKMAELKDKVKDRFVIVPRVYTSKPRTNGGGYKGMIHRPDASNDMDDLVAGLIAVRKLHQRVVKETGMYPADELLYPGLSPYLNDLLVYMAVGARSVEDQEHRFAASGVDIPVGMKNPTSGSIDVMLNAIYAAQQPQRILLGEWEVQTEGNAYAHAILRGYTNIAGENVPNYYYENLMRLHDAYYKRNLKKPAVIVDCNHSNSNKQYLEQQRIAKDVFLSCKRNIDIDRFVKGIMIESYLEDGCQMVDEGIYGKSITDPCLGWEKTERLILELGDNIG